MREIKFRAWEEKSGRYIDEGFSISMDGTCLYFEDCEEIILSEYPEITIEQFTGIRDKNGKEIYEGDIVKKVSKSDGVHWYDLDYIKAVEISPHGVEPCGEYDSDCAEHEIGEFWEVIGNIHENPELLESDNARKT